MYSMAHFIVCMGVSLILKVPGLDGHGRLWEPPGRSTMWRRGFQTPINYQDNELYCGGFSHQVSLNYKCGVCGDPYDGVRENEEGGKYATGIISRTYQQGQTVTIQVDLTANHKGYFEFKLCPKSSSGEKTTQACLDTYPLALADGSGTRYYVSNEVKIFSVPVKLPARVACDNCVLQWRYHAGNNWGRDPDGTQCVGCGYQEEFYGCADIRIVGQGGSNQLVTSNPPASTTRGTSAVVSPQTTKSYTNSNNNNAQSGSACKGIPGRTDLDSWCKVNCDMGFCPSSHCQCSVVSSRDAGQIPVSGRSCKAIGVFSTVPGADGWCQNNCVTISTCPNDMCKCS